MPRRVVTLVAALVAFLTVDFASVGAQRASAASASDFLQTGRIWTVHLTFSADAWRDLTPVRSASRVFLRRDGFLGPEGKRNGISAQSGLDFQYVHADIEIDGARFADVGVRFKGNGSYQLGVSRKPSFKVDLNKYVKGQKLAGLSTINLHSTVTDAGWMNEALAYRLYRDAGVPAPRTAYARVVITVPGRFNRQPFGLYTVVENIDSNFAQDRFKVGGGPIYKPVTRTPFAVLGSRWADYNQTYDPKTDLTPADEQRIMDFCAFVTRASDQEFSTGIGQFLDIRAFATYAAVLVWLANPDSILQQGQNYYLHVHPTTKQIAFIPWDQDHSFGSYPFLGSYAGATLNIYRPWSAVTAFLTRMFGHPAFRTAYVAELQRLTRMTFQPDRLAQQVDALAAMVRPIIQQGPDRERLALFESAVAGRAFPRPFYGGTVVPIKPFARDRHASVAAQLNTPPAAWR